MTDTVIKGSGNSRSIITVPNALTLYPTHEELMQKWATEGIPIDIGPLNEAGIETHGTDLIKPNLLTDATETAIWGSVANRTPNEALAQLRSLITSAQSTANGKLQYQSGYYSGAGNTSVRTISFNFTPQIVVIGSSTTTRMGLLVNPATFGQSIASSSGTRSITVSWGSRSVSLSSNNIDEMLNNSGIIYYYVAIG